MLTWFSPRSSKMCSLITLLSLMLWLASSGEGKNVEEVGKLYRLLEEKSYKKDVIPTAEVNGTSTAVDVIMAIDVVELINLDKNGFLEVDCFMRLQWKDFRLAFDPKEYSGIRSVVIPSSSIWTPDVALWNGIYLPNGQPMHRTMAQLHYNGTIKMHALVRLQSRCPFHFKTFPNDVHVCKLVFASVNYDSRDLNLLSLRRTFPDFRKDDLNTTDWTLTRLTNRHFHVLEVIGDTLVHYPAIEYMAVMRRRSHEGHYKHVLIIPQAVVALVTPLIFLLSKHGDRGSFGLLSMLILIVHLWMVEYYFPESYFGVPNLIRYNVAVLITAAISTFLALFVSHTLRQPHQNGVHARLKKLFAITAPSSPQHAYTAQQTHTAGFSNHSGASGGAGGGGVHFQSLNTPLVEDAEEMATMETNHADQSATPFESQNKTSTAAATTSGLGSSAQSAPLGTTSSGASASMRQLRSGLDQLNGITESLHIEAVRLRERLRVREEWDALASKLDRLLFILATVIELFFLIILR